jgi:DNA polymerase III sliding clamp (beta) subunit (PCNA family)
MKINRESLIKILEAIQPGLAAKEIVEQSTSFIFSSGVVATCNDRISVSHPTPLELEGAVRADELYKMLKRMKREEVDLETSDKELKISCGRSKSGICLQSDLSPSIVTSLEEIQKSKKQWKLLPKDFIRAIKFCAFSAGRDMTKPELTTIHIKGKAAESCDNYRLTQYLLGSSSFAEEILIPADTIQDLVRHNPTHIAITNGWIHFDNESGILYSCRQVQVPPYPDLSPMLNTKGPEIELPKDLPEALERASVFSGKGFEALIFEVTLTFSDNWLTVEGKNNVGWFEEKLRTRYKGEKICFGINPEFLHDILPILRTVQLAPNMLKFKGDAFIHCCSISTAAAEKSNV